MAIRRTRARVCSCKYCERTFNTFSTQTLWCSGSCRLRAYRLKKATQSE